MVTSSSADSGITAGIDVFSGRPNPNWPVRRADLDALERVWAALERMPVVNAQASVLGYRGCFVQEGDKRWAALQPAWLPNYFATTFAAPLNRCFLPSLNRVTM